MDDPGNSTIGLVKVNTSVRSGPYNEVSPTETVIVVTGCYAETERSYEEQQETTIARETLWAMLPVTADTQTIESNNALRYPYPPADPAKPVDYLVRAPGGAVQRNLDDELIEVWVHAERRVG